MNNNSLPLGHPVLMLCTAHIQTAIPTPLLGQLTTLVIFVVSNPAINQQTKLAAHVKLKGQGNLLSEGLVKNIENLNQDIRLLLS